MSDRAANVSALLRDRVAEAAEAVALVDVGTGASRTWQQLDADVDALARGLSSLGLVAGQRVAFALSTGTCFVTTYLAVLRAGLVAVPMNPDSAADELERMLADSGPRSRSVTPARSPGCGPRSRGTRSRAATARGRGPGPTWWSRARTWGRARSGGTSWAARAKEPW